jgi:hypothetical protein
MESCPSSVHTEETSGRAFGRCDYRAGRLAEFGHHVPVTNDLFREHDRIYHSRYLERWSECRTWAWYVRVLKTGKVRLHSNACRLRWCPICADAKARTIAYSCTDFFRDRSDVRFLTLTMKHGDIALEEQVKRLLKCFASLRRTRFWKRYVTGSVWFVQTKWSYSSNEWHNHLHMLLTGKYMPQKGLSLKWLEVTGDSRVVDIRTVHNLSRVVSDIVRYAGKPANLLKIPKERRLELLAATKNVRVCGKTGICSKLILTQPHCEPGTTEKIGSWATVMNLAQAGDLQARQILDASQNDTVLPVGVSVASVDDFLNHPDEYSLGGLGDIEEPCPNSRSPPDNSVMTDYFWN